MNGLRSEKSAVMGIGGTEEIEVIEVIEHIVEIEMIEEIEEIDTIGEGTEIGTEVITTGHVPTVKIVTFIATVKDKREARRGDEEGND